MHSLRRSGRGSLGCRRKFSGRARQLYLLLSLNRYGWLLLALSLKAGLWAAWAGFALRGLSSLIVTAFLGLMSLYSASHGVRILSLHRYKMRAFHTLVARNRKSLKENSLKKYLNSPCGRVLVRWTPIIGQRIG